MVAKRLERSELGARPVGDILDEHPFNDFIRVDRVCPQARHPRLADPVNARHEVKKGPEQRREEDHADPSDRRADVVLGHGSVDRSDGAGHDRHGEYDVGPVFAEDIVQLSDQGMHGASV